MKTLNDEIKTILLANNREFFSPIDNYVVPEQKDEFVECDYDEADMDLMLMGDNKVVVTPRDIDPDFVDDILKLFEFKNVHIVTPKDSSLGLSSNLEHDPEALDKIVALVSKSEVVDLIPWGVTKGVLSLIDVLSKKVTLRTPECPIELGGWVPDYGNTKVGTREILFKARHINKDLMLAENFVAVDIETGKDIARYFIKKGKGVVFKANLGVGGIGVNVFPLTDALKTEAGFNEMMTKIARNSLFQNCAFVVEEYISPNFESKCAFPSIEALINPDGTVEVQEYTAMVIEINKEEVVWHGIGIGKGIFASEEIVTLKEGTESVGKALYEMGYRGWINLDFLHSADGKFYCSEVNVRMSPARYLIELSKKLFGENYSEKMAIISDDKYIRSNLVNLSYTEIKKKVATLLYPINGEKRGIIITESYRSKFGRGKFGYVSIGKDIADATEIVNNVKQLLPK